MVFPVYLCPNAVARNFLIGFDMGVIDGLPIGLANSLGDGMVGVGLRMGREFQELLGR
jgi:hypothetical protein